MRYWLRVLWNYWVADCNWGTAKFGALTPEEQKARAKPGMGRWIQARQYEKMRDALQEIAREDDLVKASDGTFAIQALRRCQEQAREALKGIK